MAHVVQEQALLDWIEFEWIRQYYAQGKVHNELHEWWWTPIESLCHYHRRLVFRTQNVLQALGVFSEGDAVIWNVTEAEVARLLLEVLIKRKEELEIWHGREHGQKVFSSMDRRSLPMEPPIYLKDKSVEGSQRIGAKALSLSGIAVTIKRIQVLLGSRELSI